MNRTEATRLVAILSAAYPAAQVQPETPHAYYLALSDVPYADAERAAALLLRTSKFMPTAAEIREVLADAIVNVPAWETAWDELITTIRRYGSYLFVHPSKGDWPGWSDELIAGAVRHVGYENVCAAERDDLQTIRAQFRNAYQAEVARRKKIVQSGDAALTAIDGQRPAALKNQTA